MECNCNDRLHMMATNVVLGLGICRMIEGVEGAGGRG